MKVYFAGPLFTPYGREFISAQARRLREHGIEVFVPHEQDWGPPPRTAQLIFDKDLNGLKWANAVVALLDGEMVDDGTACEIGLFYGLMQDDPSKRGILGYLTDSRVLRAHHALHAAGINLFVLGCIEAVGAIYEDVDSVIQHLKRWDEEISTQVHR